MEALLRDVHYGLRTLLKNPGFTAVAVVTLALRIGANTAIFSIVSAVLLRPLPIKTPTVWLWFGKVGRARARRRWLAKVS